MVLGFDCGGSTGYALVDRNYKLLKYGIVKGSGEFILNYLDEVRNLYRELKPEIVVIEEPFISGGKPTAVIPLVKFIQTVTIGVLMENSEALILSVSNKTVKKHVTGNGNNKKPVVFEKIVDRYKLENFEFKTHNDITDAIALSVVGNMVLNKEIIL